jgi:hypothetical protein
MCLWERKSSIVTKPSARPPSNTGMEPTPLRGPKIGAILKARVSSIAFPISRCGAAHAQAVVPHEVLPEPVQRGVENHVTITALCVMTLPKP